MTPNPRHDPTSPGGAVDQLAAKDRRIAELEAELAAYRDFEIGHGEKVNLSLLLRELNRVDGDRAMQKAQTEKAEAEAAKLRGIVLGTPCPKCDCEDCKKAVAHYRDLEAEVERLTTILRDIQKHISLCHDSSDSNLDSFYEWAGGRESDVREAERANASTQDAPGNAAALCPECHHTAHGDSMCEADGDCECWPWAAARKKERDG